MKLLFTVFLLIIMNSLFAEDVVVDGKEVNVNGRKVIYTYKQFEKFDFDDINVEGEAGAPNDLSISPVHEKSYSNRLPYRKSFTVEIKKGIERVR
jgi:hypothetical protein